MPVSETTPVVGACSFVTEPTESPSERNDCGLDSFAGEIHHTAHWPHEGVDFAGERVGVIGTGSSGIQAIPYIAEEAAQLYVFRRTPNYSVPAGNIPLDEATRAAQKAGYAERRRMSWLSGGGSPHQPHAKSALEVSDDELRETYERRWQLGGVLFSKAFPDQLVTLEANDTARRFWEDKVRAVIDDPAVADLLIPKDYPIGAKRICTDDNYFQTFNSDHVHLVNLRAAPIERIDASGIETRNPLGRKRFGVAVVLEPQRVETGGDHHCRRKAGQGRAKLCGIGMVTVTSPPSSSAVRAAQHSAAYTSSAGAGHRDSGASR